MSPKLKPLLLPQLVEERRALETQQVISPDCDPSYVYSADNTSSSDIGSPITPTFSQRSGHARVSSSTSSLELVPPVPASADSPISPTQLGYTTKSTKSQLPDVQEDPAEREEDETALVRNEAKSLEYCLCDEPCSHGETGGFDTPGIYDYDDAGFLSDSDFSTSSRTSKRRRDMVESSLSGITAQITSRIPGLSRLRSNSKRSNLTFSPASDPSLDLRPTMSRAPSSRSSSISAPVRHAPDRSFEPPLPPTPALSYYGSTESIVMPPTHEIIDMASVQQSLARERAMATTPLLPPLMTNLPSSSQPQSVAQSPLQSPTIAPSPSVTDAMASQVFSLPPLSTKPSLSSVRPAAISMSAPATAPASELPSPLPAFDFFEQVDAWSDRLGHANYTIVPKPYQPGCATLGELQHFRTDWDQARVNYTKHLARTGEHYGSTSKTFALTEAKWSETEHEWKAEHDHLVDRIVASGECIAFPQQEWSRLQGEVPSIIPRMLDAKGKFPELGDQDIVGPMIRDAFMVRDQLTADERQSTSKFWRSFAGKVGLRM